MLLYSFNTTLASDFATPMKLTVAILFDRADDRLIAAITA